MRKKLNLKPGYIQRKVAIHGTRKKPITTSLLIKRYNRFIKNLSAESLNKLQQEHEQYGIQFMTKIDKRLNISNKEKRYLIERTMGVYSGVYQESRKALFISNYIYALKVSGVNDDIISDIYSILYSKSSSELALIIKSQAIPSAFIFYEGGSSEERAKQLEDDLSLFIEDENLSNNDNLSFEDIL